MDDADDELARAVADLGRTLRELREELEPRRRDVPPRPPTPRELLRLTDEVAIPALIALLEANVRALEAFQRGLRLVRREREVRDRATDAGETTRERAAELQETTLDRLDGALVELQRALSERDLPQDRRARELLEDARDLRDEVDDRLREATEPSGDESADPRRDARTIEIADPDEADEDESGVDVDAELETLRDRYGPDRDAEEDGLDADDGAPGADDAGPDTDDRNDADNREDSSVAGDDSGATDGRDDAGDEPDR